MNEAKKTATRELLMGIATHMVDAPFTQIERPSAAVDELEAMMMSATGVSDGDLYDAIQRLSQRPCPSEISTFVRAVCDLDEYYLRPAQPNSVAQKDEAKT